ncbi:type VI secretion system ATPase TssH [Suicoccus acidiformans]|uniref:Type VI secretion system ATPase TssH n=1 Tax=Suicoccus acidiformans TaxID=2036206 RepID=A0A347WNQ5_9LACT|nr:AAA family ATPase [Suicoccus acidiformans]AXY26712.1 type VI secretion system ATPase TssH [Suicoccus acidiformans]
MMEYTREVEDIITEAQQVAENRGNHTTDVVHIWFVLTRSKTKTAEIYQALEAGLIELRRLIVRLANQIEDEDQAVYSQNFIKLLEDSEQYTVKLNHPKVSQEAIMLAIYKQNNHPITQYLIDQGVGEEQLWTYLRNRFGPLGRINELDALMPNLAKYATNMNRLAIEGEMDPVIGREEEMQDLIRILSRRRKNNPVLIGPPGVGKSAIMDGLVQRIIKGDVPRNLEDKQIYALNLGNLLAGARYRGEFEERLKFLLEEVATSEGEIILYLNELHSIVGSGASDGAIDASNMLKPLFARGDLNLIGATTVEEYRNRIEKDPALERQFQRVHVNEPTVAETIRLLRGLKQQFEAYHQVQITDRALVAAANLGDRYINDRYLPDKAIDLIDEASATVRVQLNTTPTELDTINRQIQQLEVELSSLEYDNEKQTDRFKTNIKQDLEKKRNEKEALEKQIRKEDQLLEQLQQAEQILENSRKNEDNLDEIQANREKVQRLKDSLNNQICLRKDKVTANEVAQVVGRLTGIPVTRLIEGEREKLIHLPEILHERVIGQDEGINTVTQAVIRSRAGIQSPKKPIGSFLFMGPTGVGKTELARSLADALFDDEDQMVRIDMSEYMERHNVSRLIGAPPGYVGYEEGGQLTEAVRKNPYSIVLLDEIEKAHQDVYNLLLQVLDEGRLTDSQGRHVDFKNVILIMTSNLGSKILLDEQTSDGKILSSTQDKVNQLLRDHFRPEFLNRIDDIVLFSPLTQDNMVQIVEKMLKEVNRRLLDRGVRLLLDDEAKAWLAEEGYDANFGARPLQRFITRELETPVANAMIRNQIPDNTDVLVSLTEGHLDFSVEAVD